MSESPYLPPQTEAFPQKASHPSVKAPAIGLIVVGILAAAISLTLVTAIFLGLNMPLAEVMVEEDLSGKIGLVLYGFYYGIQVPAGLFVAYSGFKMKNLEHYVLVMIGAIVAMMLNLGYCCWLGLPCGVWAIVVLTKKNVKMAFKRNKNPG